MKGMKEIKKSTGIIAVIAINLLTFAVVRIFIWEGNFRYDLLMALMFGRPIVSIAVAAWEPLAGIISAAAFPVGLWYGATYAVEYPGYGGMDDSGYKCALLFRIVTVAACLGIWLVKYLKTKREKDNTIV